MAKIACVSVLNRWDGKLGLEPLGRGSLFLNMGRLRLTHFSRHSVSSRLTVEELLKLIEET